MVPVVTSFAMYVPPISVVTSRCFSSCGRRQRQITFLHVYHHATMILNWWLGVAYVAGRPM